MWLVIENERKMQCRYTFIKAFFAVAFAAHIYQTEHGLLSVCKIPASKSIALTRGMVSDMSSFGSPLGR